jgi:tRNA(Ile)-lysidine synthase
MAKLSTPAERVKLHRNVQRAVSSVLAIVQRTIATHDLLGRGERILVAVSGGPDSTALLAVLAALRARWRLDLVAGHVNHGLRGAEAEGDEACAAAVSARLGVRFCAERLEAAAFTAGGSLEAQAREARYRALHAMAAAWGCTRIATGHTQDDQAETILLRLARGSAPAGLSGIQPRRADGVIRPLLGCTRTQILTLLAATGLPYRRDRMNEDARFRRVYVRREVMPALHRMNPRVAAALARMADLARAERVIVEQWVAASLGTVTRGDTLNLPALASVPPALHGYVVRRWLLQQGVAERRLSAQHVGAVLRLAASPDPSGTVALPGGGRVARRYQEMCVQRISAIAPPLNTQALAAGRSIRLPGGWQLRAEAIRPVQSHEARPPDLWTAVCDADRLAGPLVVRPARRGERIRPLGLGGTRKLSDVFVDRKVPAPERRGYPLVEYAGEIVWVPGVVRAESLRVGGTTRTVLWLHATRVNPVAGGETPC